MTEKQAVVLIQTPCYELSDDRLEPSLGLLYLATWLNKNGFPSQIVDLSSVPAADWTKSIPPADVYGFSTYTPTYNRTLQVLQAAKLVNPDAMTVAGGPHASALPELISRDFDYVVVGEGENALLALVKALDRGEALPAILNYEPIRDLDTLPSPDYSLVDVRSYHRIVDGKPSLSILSSRGCPYHCVFCNSIIMGRGHKIRFRSAGNVVQEIRQIKSKWGVQAFRFQDDIFIINLLRLRQLTLQLEKEEIVYRCFGRIDRCSRETAELLRQGGCQHIAFGVESGSNLILRQMHKRQTKEDVRQGIVNAKAAGLVVRVYLMVGFPGETWDTIQQTVDLMLECLPDEFSVYPLIPYPGTLLYQQPEKYNIQAINPDFSLYYQVQRARGTGIVYRTRELDEAKITAMRHYMIDKLEQSIVWAGDSKGFR